MPHPRSKNADQSLGVVPDHIPPTPPLESEETTNAAAAAKGSATLDFDADSAESSVFVLSSDEESDSSPHSPSTKALSHPRSGALVATAQLPPPPLSEHTPHSALSEFLSVSLATILHSRGLYPPSCFTHSQYAAVPAPAPRHPLLASYLTSLSALLDEGIPTHGHSRITIPIFPPSVAAAVAAPGTADSGGGGALMGDSSGCAPAPALATGLPSALAAATAAAAAAAAAATEAEAGAGAGAGVGASGRSEGSMIYPIMRPLERYIFDIIVVPPPSPSQPPLSLPQSQSQPQSPPPPPLLSLAALSSLQLLCGATVTRLDAAARWVLPRWRLHPSQHDGGGGKTYGKDKGKDKGKGAGVGSGDPEEDAMVPQGSWFRVLLTENGDDGDGDGDDDNESNDNGEGDDGSALLGVAAGATGEALLSAHHHRRWVPASTVAAATPASAAAGDGGAGGAEVVAVHDFSWYCSRSGMNVCKEDDEDAWEVHVMVFAEFAKSSPGLEPL